MMKRVVALALCLIMAVLALASCGGSIALDAEDKGDIFNAYIAGDMFSFDPGKDFTDENASKYYGMIYEGLFRLNKDGKVENALAKSVKIVEDDTKGEYKMQIALKETKWSDGNALTADDFVYAWKRIMKSNYKSTAAGLLYDVKNARAVKAGDVSVDELGVSAPSTYMLEISFEGKIDYENFKKNLASLALVPLRESAVTEDLDNWARRHATLVTNGPFAIKSINREEGTMRIERNVYYYRDTLEDKLDRYVNPYRINVTFIKDEDAKLTSGQKVKPDDLEAIYEQYLAGEVLYMGDIPLSKRAEVKKNAHVTDANSTYSYLFNTNNELFSDYRVRAALSMAIDTLSEANTELQTRFSPMISQRAGEILSHITGGRYEKLLFDKSFEAGAKTTDDVIARNSLALSEGTADEIYLALRLAMCQLILNGEEPCPIVLDDALANFDDKRCAATLEYLKEMAKDRQIIVFTCHRREAELVNGDNVKVIDAN